MTHDTRRPAVRKIRNPKSAIRSPKPAGNRQQAASSRQRAVRKIRNPQSEIRNPQSKGGAHGADAGGQRGGEPETQNLDR
jgi:hypothetical protein